MDNRKNVGPHGDTIDFDLETCKFQLVMRAEGLLIPAKVPRTVTAGARFWGYRMNGGT